MAAKFNLLIIGVFVILAVFFATTPQIHTDTYWHLAVGRQIWQTKSIPTTDSFVYAFKNTAFIPVEWLSGLIFYLLFKTLGFWGLTLLRVTIGLLTFYFFYRTTALFTQNSKVKIIATMLAAYILATRMNNRPEMFSYLFFSQINYIGLAKIYKNKFSRLAYLLPITFLLWPNLHGYAIIGLGLLLYFTSLIFWEKIVSKTLKEKVAAFTLISLICLTISLIQYKNLSSFLIIYKIRNFPDSEFYSMLNRLQTISHDFLRTASVELYVYFAVLLLFLTLLTITIKTQGLEPKSLGLSALYLGLMLLPIASYRIIPLSILLTAPYLLYLSKYFHLNFPPEFKEIVLSGILIVLTLMILVSSISKHVFGFVESPLIVFDDKTGKYHGVTYDWEPYFPKKAAEIIGKYLNTGRILAPDQWYTFFIWKVPNIKVYKDPLLEYRTLADYHDDYILISGSNDWQSLVKKYDIDTIVNSPLNFYAPRDLPVRQMANWQLVYIDSDYQIYARNDVIKAHPVDLSALNLAEYNALDIKPEDEAKTIEELKDLLAFENTNNFARQKLINYYMKKNDIRKAESLAMESRAILPQNPEYSLRLADIYAKNNNCPKAKLFAQEAIAKSHNTYLVANSDPELFSACNIDYGN